MLDNKLSYLKQVDKTLEKLRTLCLGQNPYLTAILPNHLLKQPEDIQAKHISEQIIFAMATVNTEAISEEQLAASRMWLYALTQYLLLECNKEDQTFQQLKHLIFLPKGVRETFFNTYLGNMGKTCLQENPPSLLDSLDEAIWWLLTVQGGTSVAKTTYSKLVDIL